MKISQLFNHFALGMSNIFQGIDQEWVTEVLIHSKKYYILHVPLLENLTHWRALNAAGGSEENLLKYINAAKEKKLKKLFASVQSQYPINPIKADRPSLYKMRMSFEKSPDKEDIHRKIQNALETTQVIDSSTTTVKQVREWLYYNEMLTADEHEITAEIMEEVRGIYSFVKKDGPNLNLGLAKYLLSIQEKKFNDFKKILVQEDSHPEILRHIKKTKVLIEDLQKKI